MEGAEEIDNESGYENDEFDSENSLMREDAVSLEDFENRTGQDFENKTVPSFIRL